MLVFCSSCGKRISDRVAACPFCGAVRSDGSRPAYVEATEMRTSASPGIKAGGGVVSSAALPRPIWNPNAACIWAALLSPAFGAYIHALNWMTLNEPEKARSAKVWFYVSLVMIGVYMLLPLVGVDKLVGGCLPLLYLSIWYFAAGRPQVRYVKEKYGKDYPRRTFDKPLLIYILAVVLVEMVAVMAHLVRRG